VSTAGGAATSASPTTAAAVGNPNGILHYGYDYSAQFTNLDPGKSTGNCDEIVSYPIYDTLVHKDLAGNLQPGLAMSWDVSGTVLTLHLRPNVTFSDGEPFNSDAVKTGLLHNQKNTQYADLGPITSIDTPDPTTVTINYKDNTVIQLVYSFTGEEGMIVAPNAIATASTHPVGAGPFMLTSFNSGATTSVRTNPTYWDKGAYKFGGIDFIQVGTGPPAVTALKAGSVDMIRFEAESYEGLKATPNVGVAAQPTGAYLQFQFRFKPPFDNLMVRQAVEFAINKQQINQVVQDGQGQVADEPYQSQSGSYDPAVAHLYSFDPTKAHQLLVQSGLPLPVKFDMVIPGGNITNMERQGAILQQELNAVGFDVTIKRVLGNDIATGYYIGGQGNVFAAEKLAEPYPPNLLWGAYGKGQFVAKYSSGENADITNLITQAFSADIATANKLDQQAVDIVMQQALDVPIAFAPQFIAYNNQVVGGTVHGQTNICDHPDLTGVIIKK
jgi:peptide/nickel transport system substrate-binding protein